MVFWHPPKMDDDNGHDSIRASLRSVNARLGRLEGIVESRVRDLAREREDVNRRFSDINATGLAERIDTCISRLDRFDTSVKLIAWLVGMAITALSVWIAYVHIKD